MDEEPRRATVPVLYTRGTHYEVGYDIVSPLIHSICKKVGAVRYQMSLSVFGAMGNHHFPFFQIFPIQNLHRNGFFGKTSVSPMVGCWRFFDHGILGGLLLLRSKLFLLSLAAIQANTRGGDQNIQRIGC